MAELGDQDTKAEESNMSEKTEGPNKIKEDMNEDSKEICESKEEEQNGDSETITENQATNADPQNENENENDLDKMMKIQPIKETIKMKKQSAMMMI